MGRQLRAVLQDGALEAVLVVEAGGALVLVAHGAAAALMLLSSSLDCADGQLARALGVDPRRIRLLGVRDGTLR